VCGKPFNFLSTYKDTDESAIIQQDGHITEMLSNINYNITPWLSRSNQFVRLIVKQ